MIGFYKAKNFQIIIDKKEGGNMRCSYKDEKKEKYDKCHLRYNVKEDPIYHKMNQENYALMKEALKSVGVDFEINGGVLDMRIDSWEYVSVVDRYAGRTRMPVMRKCEDNSYEPYMYSDIVLMKTQKIRDKAIAEKLEISIASYYRRKKKMFESSYYKSLDPNKTWDKEYLESVSGNRDF